MIKKLAPERFRSGKQVFLVETYDAEVDLQEAYKYRYKNINN